MEALKFCVSSLKIEIYANREEAGAAAAAAAAKVIQAQAAAAQNGRNVGVIFATGASQLEVLRHLTSLPDVHWDRVIGFHLDEYIGIGADHPASFRRYLREKLTERVGMRRFLEVDGSASDPARVAHEYAEQLRLAAPRLCLLGIGENGHIAFNDPGEANFDDPSDVKVVELDSVSRQQQASEGWFATAQDVPERAITLTIPAILRVPQLIVTAPGKRKAHIVHKALNDAISTACPATVLRTHPDATLYLDQDSASNLGPMLPPSLKNLTRAGLA